MGGNLTVCIAVHVYIHGAIYNKLKLSIAINVSMPFREFLAALLVV
jgi:hypothetical protein